MKKNKNEKYIIYNISFIKIMSQSTTDNELKNFQNNLKNNKDTSSKFIHNNNEGDCSDCSEEGSGNNTYNIKIPGKKSGKSGNNNINYNLLCQIINQQNTISKIQKKMYKLQSELDQEEIKSRYTRLELNNTQVDIDEYQDTIKNIKKNLYTSRIENWIVRIMSFMCIVIYIYEFIKH